MRLVRSPVRPAAWGSARRRVVYLSSRLDYTVCHVYLQLGHGHKGVSIWTMSIERNLETGRTSS